MTYRKRVADLGLDSSGIKPCCLGTKVLNVGDFFPGECSLRDCATSAHKVSQEKGEKTNNTSKALCTEPGKAVLYPLTF